MNQAGTHSNSRNDQYLFKYHPLQNAPLLLLNQTRDIVRYGPLAPYMSLGKEQFNIDVPFFSIDACRLPEWPYNHLYSRQKTSLCSPAIPVLPDLQQNNQYCQPLTIFDSTLGQQEWMRGSLIPVLKEPLPTVSCHSDISSIPHGPSTERTFSHSDIYRTSKSAQLALQYNNDVCFMQQPGKYLQNVDPFKTECARPPWMPIVTSGTVNWASSHPFLDSHVNDSQDSFLNLLSTCYDKRPIKNYSHLPTAEEPLNLIVHSNQTPNHILPLLSPPSSLSTSSSSSSLSASISSSSLSMTFAHPLSVSSLSRSACAPVTFLASNSVHNQKDVKLDQRGSSLPKRGCSYIQCECCSSTTENDSSGNNHTKQVHSTDHVNNSKEKGYHPSSQVNKITDSFSKNSTLSAMNQSLSCDRAVCSVNISSTEAMNTQHRAFQYIPRNFERGSEHINMSNRERPNEYNYSVSPSKDFSRLSGIRMHEKQGNLQPSLERSPMEEVCLTERIDRNSMVGLAHGQERIVPKIQQESKRLSFSRNQGESVSDYDCRTINNIDLHGNLSSNSANTINAKIPPYPSWKDIQELSAFQKATLLHFQHQRDNSFAELLSDKRNATDPTKNRCSTYTVSEANLALNDACNEIRLSNQPLINTNREFDLNKHNNICSSSRIRPVRILIGTSQNDDEVMPHIATTERSLLNKSRLPISQSHPAKQPENSLSEHRKELYIHPPAPFPNIQELKGLKKLEESRIKRVRCVSTITNPYESNPPRVTDCDKRINYEPEEKEYYDLNTRNIVPYSSHLPTNPDGVHHPYLSEKDLSTPDHVANTCHPQDIACHPYEPRSVFISMSPGQSVCNQNSQEENSISTQIQESQPHYTILSSSNPNERLTHSSSMTILESLEKDSTPDCDCQSNTTSKDDSSSICNIKNHRINYKEVLVPENTPFQPEQDSMECTDINKVINTGWNNDDSDSSQTMESSISDSTKTDSANKNTNNSNRRFELSNSTLVDRLQNKGKHHLPTSESDAERSAAIVHSNEESILMLNEGENDVIPTNVSESVQLPLTTPSDRSVTTTKASDINATLVLGDSSETMNVNLNINPQCVYCEKNFSSTEMLQEHLKTHMVSTPYQCPHCSLGFVSKARLLRHIQLHLNAKPYKCEECKNLFSTVTAFHRHLHSKKHSGKKLYKCKECGLSFINENYVNLHYKTHTGEHPFQCEQCGNIFACKNNLKNHIMTHTGEKPYQCVHCAKRFVTNFSLKVHIRTHTKEYPYRCDICNKRFLCSSNMASHLRTHTGEKRHQCYKCGKFLSSWSGLQGHQRTHTKECPFSCYLCSKSFSSKFSLRIHQRIHSGENPHKCKYCDKCFSNSSNLQRHLRTHTGEKPYQCTYCGKTFCSSTYLKSHIRTHTGEKPHICKFCGKGFSNTSCFKQHVKKHEQL